MILGLLTLGAGYFIALTVQSPLQALILFFAAVILVIIGTYCLFVTGTTFVLKCLKRNKRYYYSSRHMPAVAGLLFRMKQNAVGLASIAILATGVLVMISSTVSLYSGVQDTMETNYPQHLYLSANRVRGDIVTPISAGELSAIVEETAEKYGVAIESVENTPMLTVSYLLRGDALLTKTEAEGGWSTEEITGAVFITESTYSQLRGKAAQTDPDRLMDPASLRLAEDEIAFCRIQSTVPNLGNAPTSLTIGGQEYRVRENLTYFPVSSNLGTIVNVIGIVVADEEVLDGIYRAQKEAYGEFASEYADRISVTFADEAAVSAVGMELNRSIEEKLLSSYPGEKLSFSLDTKWEALHNVLDMYGTFLFLGILLGFVCLFSTILIIYYKQISEGYEDAKRFDIMQKVGMTKKEIRASISTQLLTVFALPLAFAGLHLAFAFPMIRRLLTLFSLYNVGLFARTTLISFAVFALPSLPRTASSFSSASNVTTTCIPFSASSSILFTPSPQVSFRSKPSSL